MRKPVAVQLWTLREEIEQDMAGTLSQTAEIGYAGVELWFATFPAAARLKKVLAECQLRVISAHVPFLELRDHFQQVAEYHREIGNRDLVIPILPESLRRTGDDWRQRVVEIKAIAEQCCAAGFRLSYHNHAIEFTDHVGKVQAHDYIFSSIGADLLKAELDTRFIQSVGKDPAAYIRRYAGRVPLLHLKDQSKADPARDTEVGRGVVDWDAVFAAAEAAGVQWYVVEQNCQEFPALESIKISFDYLRARGIA